jgi:hypothetical protein
MSETSREPRYFSSLKTEKHEGKSWFAIASMSLRFSSMLGGKRLRYWLKTALTLFVELRFIWIRPHRLTVAGVRFLSESVSKMNVNEGSIFKISPLPKKSYLFSSRTEFKFSAHS